MVKRGGEQVSLLEMENLIKNLLTVCPFVTTTSEEESTSKEAQGEDSFPPRRENAPCGEVYCFAVPHEIYGEEVGCAIVLPDEEMMAWSSSSFGGGTKAAADVVETVITPVHSHTSPYRICGPVHRSP